MSRIPLAAFGLFAGLVCLTVPGRADAEGTYFLLEAQSGLSESPFQQGDAGLHLGIASGLTFKPIGAGLRIHLLSGLAFRNASSLGGLYGGVPFDVSQGDVDLYVSTRLVVPVFGAFRAYAEVGAGNRWSMQSIARGGGLGSLSVHSSDFVLITAVGLQARFSKLLSVGARFEIDPLTPDHTLLTEITGLSPTERRMTGTLQLGIHF